MTDLVFAGSEMVNSDAVCAVSVPAPFDFVCADSAQSAQIVPVLNFGSINSSHSVNFANDFFADFSIGYDDAILQKFTQIAGAEAKPAKTVQKLAPSI